MKNTLKILLATDFSRSSKTAMRNLKLLKEAFKLDVSIIHVIKSFWKEWLSSGQYKKEAAQRLKSWQKELSNTSEPEKLFVEIGNRSDAVLSTAEALDVDLIVLGSKNTESGGRYKAGTTVESVVRNAKKSVLVCKSETITKILCGIDGSESSAGALKWAIDLARRFNATLTLLFVITKADIDGLGIPEDVILEEEEKIEKESSDKVQKFLEDFDMSDIDVEKMIGWGAPSHVLLDTAEDFDYDLIVIGAKGHSILHHVLIGSTAEKVLRFSPCSLMVVR